jgi:uncharacterized protein
MQATNLRGHKRKFAANRKYFRFFISRMENNPPKKLGKIVAAADKKVWTEVDCMSCANCCKRMSPTFNLRDIDRISAYLKMTPKEFKSKWLYYDSKDRDWMNKAQPCQFLDLKTNKCTIYEVRPDDCAGFPHLVKKPLADYIHVHKQNIEYCPATMLFVEKMIAAVKAG